MLNKKKTSSGFTLIELLVVTSIIGVLASVALVSLRTARIKALDVKRIADLNQMQKALDLYFDQNNAYPRYESGQPVTCSGSGWASNQGAYVNCWSDLQTKLSPYMARLPQDPNFVSDPNVAYWYKTMKSGQGYYLIALTQQSNISATQGEACHDGLNSGDYYCVGINWQ